jgi:hypothetical protein
VITVNRSRSRVVDSDRKSRSRYRVFFLCDCGFNVSPSPLCLGMKSYGSKCCRQNVPDLWFFIAVPPGTLTIVFKRDGTLNDFSCLVTPN